MDSDSTDISSSILNDTITINMNGVDPTWLTGGSNAYTYTGTSTNRAWNTTSIDHTLRVHGDSEFAGDITVQGRSLTEFMDSVEQRLNILRPNTALESEWDQLRELGNQYRALEQQLTEKVQMWDVLKR